MLPGSTPGDVLKERRKKTNEIEEGTDDEWAIGRSNESGGGGVMRRLVKRRTVGD